MDEYLEYLDDQFSKEIGMKEKIEEEVRESRKTPEEDDQAYQQYTKNRKSCNNLLR